MANPGFIGYVIGAAVFGVLAALLATGWRGRLPGALLVAAVGLNALWAALLAYDAAVATTSWPHWITSLEVVRAGVWLLFLLSVLFGAPQRLVRSRLFWVTVMASSLVLVLALVPTTSYIQVLGPDRAHSLRFAGLLMLALTGLLLVEQVFRNVLPEARWVVKFLCLGLLGLFSYDLLLWVHAFLTGVADPTLWAARGVVNALVAPLIAVSAARSRDWSTEIFVSRQVVFYTSSLIIFGAFLVLMAVGAYYIRIYGGTWGGFAGVVVLFSAVIGVSALVLSASLRARFRVFLSKHFYSNRYDYRKEWLELISILSEQDPASLPERVLLGIERIVESTGGALWVREHGAGYACRAHHNMHCPGAPLDSNDPLIRFLDDSDWVVDLAELRSKPDRHGGLTIPGWLEGLQRAWLVVPLRQNDALVGFMVLAQSRAPRDLNWEDWDLLRTAGREAASYLALAAASDELARARQFEAFNRLSAYVVHDLKNLVAQLGLVVSNAARHRENPAFMADAIQTVDHAVAKMNRLLGQLRKDRFVVQESDIVDVNRVAHEVVAERQSQAPRPTLVDCDDVLQVLGNRDRLVSVLEHLIQNAQEATPPEGTVSLRLYRDGDWGMLEVQDSGAGMDESFVKERLFRPFETTKGNAGLGMGAYQVRETVRLMGGRVDVRSRPGSGTIFEIRLPLYRAQSNVMTA